MNTNVALLRASSRSRSSHSRVAKKLSHMALSYASPTEPIEGRTPASRQRWPNSIEVYWLHSNSRRNTLKEELRSQGAGVRLRASDQRDGVGPVFPLVPFVEPNCPPDRELVFLLAVSDIA